MLQKDEQIDRKQWIVEKETENNGWIIKMDGH